jgi:hypothetical protein
LRAAQKELIQECAGLGAYLDFVPQGETKKINPAPKTTNVVTETFELSTFSLPAERFSKTPASLPDIAGKFTNERVRVLVSPPITGREDHASLMRLLNQTN